jgi:hypothetical protein
MLECAIEVIMNPHTWDNKYKPYFWCIFAIREDCRTNEGCGWAKTPELAWQEAFDYYNRYTKNRLD